MLVDISWYWLLKLLIFGFFHFSNLRFLKWLVSVYQVAYIDNLEVVIFNVGRWFFFFLLKLQILLSLIFQNSCDFRNNAWFSRFCWSFRFGWKFIIWNLCFWIWLIYCFDLWSCSFSFIWSFNAHVLLNCWCLTFSVSCNVLITLRRRYPFFFLLQLRIGHCKLNFEFVSPFLLLIKVEYYYTWLEDSWMK